MICVSIGRGRHKHMIAEHRHLVEQGAQLVELRLDYVRTAVNLKRLLDQRPCPIIATCRREQDGGVWSKTEDERLMLLRTAIADGADYVDLEDDVAASIPRFGKTKRIVSYHNFRETPENLNQIYDRLAALDADIVKIATMAHNPHDNVRMLRMIRDAELPTVGMCMGDIGTPSRILAGRFGAPFTYATFHHERALAPGQLSYRQMTGIYHYDRIDSETTVFGVIADPIGHSLSPLIHNAAFRHQMLNHVYVPFRVPREDLGQFLGDCEELGIRGLSVTIPHKEEVLQYLTETDPAVTAIGAANTILFDDGRLIGHNTDCQAAVDSVVDALGESDSKQPLSGRVALLLGAGGVAKAIAHGMKAAGADVVITNRTPERAKELAQRIGGRTVDWSARHSTKCGILVNCTPVGMHPHVDESPFERLHLKRTTVVFDTVYNPEQTLLVKQARQQGCRVITGVDMFVRQAALQFELFARQQAPVDVMRQHLRSAIGAARP